MKQTILSFLIAIAIIPFHAYSRDLATVESTKTLKVAIDGMTPPFNSMEGQNPVGFEVDLISEIARRLGVKVEWTVQNFNTLLVGLGQDRFDIIATGHCITEKRKKVADFVDPHYCTGATIVTKRGGPTKKNELSGKVAVVPLGTVYYDALKEIPGVKEIRTVPQEVDGLNTLLNGRSDIWVTDEFVAREMLKTHSKDNLVLGESIMDQQNAFVVSKGNDSLRLAVDKVLGETLKDGYYKKLSMHYFDRDIRCQAALNKDGLKEGPKTKENSKKQHEMSHQSATKSQ